MVKTASRMLRLGTKLPSFHLPVVPKNVLKNSNNFDQWLWLQNQNFQSKPVLLMILCAHCPFVKHIESALTQLNYDYRDKVDFLGVSSNSLETHPEDGPDYLAKQAKANDWDFPYLLDSTQSFAKSLQAACTPDFFIFSPLTDGDQILKYRGQLDSSRPGNNIPVSAFDLRAALDAILDGDEPSIEQKPSIGCNIKWHPGQEPSWFI